VKKSLVVLVLFVAVELFSTNALAEKSPVLAGVMSGVLPGAGQFYTGHPMKGLTMGTLYVGSMGLVIAYGPWTWEDKQSGFFGDLSEGTSSTTKAIWYGSVAVAGGTWLWSVIDAPIAAGKYNQENFSVYPVFRKGYVGVNLNLKVTL